MLVISLQLCTNIKHLQFFNCLNTISPNHICGDYYKIRDVFVAFVGCDIIFVIEQIHLSGYSKICRIRTLSISAFLIH